MAHHAAEESAKYAPARYGWTVDTHVVRRSAHSDVIIRQRGHALLLAGHRRRLCDVTGGRATVTTADQRSGRAPVAAHNPASGRRRLTAAGARPLQSTVQCSVQTGESLIGPGGQRNQPLAQPLMDRVADHRRPWADMICVEGASSDRRAVRRDR